MEEKKAMLLEGLVPVDVWNTIVVLLIMFGVFMAVFKGVVAIRDEIDKRRKKKQLADTDIADQIADKVMEKVQPQLKVQLKEQLDVINRRLEEIDRKLDNDNDILNEHTDQLDDHENRVNELEGGNKALCHGMLALLERDPGLAKAQAAMKSYLIDGTYNEGDWK